MKRNYRLEIPLSKEELERIKKKAEQYGMTASSFSRLILLNSQIKEIEINLNNNKV
jgi:predicted DNA binding CopG/RHH family protein